MNETKTRRAATALARQLTLERIAIVLLILALAPIASPFLQPGFPEGHDTDAHVTYLYRFDQALRQGQLPVRWVEGTRPGYNQPLFNFYQVGFYYLVTLVHLVVPRLSDAFKLTIVLLWWLGSAFVFALFKRCGTAAAAMAAVLFGLSPYLIVDGLVRGAAPELAAIAFAIGVLWSIDRWLTTGRARYIPALSALLAMTMLCHLPATVIVVPVCVLHVAWLAVTRQTTTARVIGLVPALALGAGLAAFYVMPALLEADLVQIRRMTQGGMDFHDSFVPLEQWTRFAIGYRWSFGGSVHDVGDLIPVHISVAQLIFIGAAVGVVAVRLARRDVDWRVGGLIEWLAVTAFAVGMMTSISAPVWEMIPALAYIQFPWRFFMLLSLSGAALGALLMAIVADRRVQAALLIATIGLQVHLYHRRLKTRSVIPLTATNIDDPAWRHTPEGKLWGYYETAYDPVGVTRPPPDGIGRWTIVGGSGTIAAQAVADAALTLVTSSADGMTVRINSHAFPGWVAQLDGHEVAITTTPEDGYMAIAVPAGVHRVDVRFANTPIRAAANAISIGSAAVLAVAFGGLGLGRIRRARGRENEAAAPQSGV